MSDLRPDLWRNAKRILAVRLDSLGDVLMTTPAIRAFQESIPGSHITLLTSQAAVDAGRMVPEINEVIGYDVPWVKATAPRKTSQPDLAMIQHLRDLHFDAAIIFTVYSQNPLPAALMTYLADIPLRLSHCRENPYQLLTDWVKDSEPENGIRHEVRRQLDLALAVGCKPSSERLSLRVNPADLSSIQIKLARLPFDITRPWIVIHPGASAPSRRYSPDGFAEVARKLIAENQVQVIFTGVQAECTLVETIVGLAPGSLSLAGELSLGEMAALIQAAPLLISNNTGPVHMAAALGTPVVVLYALTNPQHTPWEVPSRVLSYDVPCKYCYKSICPELHHNCLRLISPSAVIEAAQQLLKENTAFNRKMGLQ